MRSRVGVFGFVITAETKDPIELDRLYNLFEKGMKQIQRELQISADRDSLTKHLNVKVTLE